MWPILKANFQNNKFAVWLCYITFFILLIIDLGWTRSGNYLLVDKKFFNKIQREARLTLDQPMLPGFGRKLPALKRYYLGQQYK